MKDTFTKYGLIIVTMLAAITYYGIYNFASPCAPAHDGMHCIEARNTIARVLVAMQILSVVGLINFRPIRVVFTAAINGLSLIALLLPGTILPLCMITRMRCYTHMQPFVRVMMTITLIYSVVYGICYLKHDKENSNEHTEASSK